MKYSVTRRFEFDAAHRVLGHQGKCRFLHGHRYAALVTVCAIDLDKLGMVVDFTVIKQKVGMWIELNYDHNILLNTDDPICHMKLADMNAITANRAPAVFVGNPTAENIARDIYQAAARLLRDDGLRVEKVRVYETPNCYADYYG